MTTHPPVITRRSALTWIFLIWASLFAMRVIGPDDLMDKDQERPAAYVQDAVINGNWVIQTDLGGDISSKPPLYTWLSGLTTLAAGRISSLTLYLAPGLATLAIALLIWLTGSRCWDGRVGFLCALVYLVSAVAAKQMALARTDGVFAFTVTLTALLAYRSWTTGKGWGWFWVAAAAATLTKGPAGLVFGAGGLVAVFWERREQRGTQAGQLADASTRRKSGSGPLAPFSYLLSPCGRAHLIGVLLYFAIAAGWFYAAYLDMGQPVIDKMIHRELLGHATGSETSHLPGSLFYKPPLLFLARYAPWSLLAFVGFWRVWRHPAVSPEERRFERFLFCWFWVGLGVLALGAHQRGDLLNPMIPAAALIAGREASRWLARWQPKRYGPTVAVATLVGLLLIVGKYYWLRPMDRYVKQTAEIQALAEDLDRRLGPEFPFTYLDVPYALQVYLNTLHREPSPERVARLLQGEAAAFVWVSEETALAFLTNGPARVHTLMKVPLTERPDLQLLSNRETLKWETDLALCLGPLDVRMTGMRPVSLADQRLSFEVTKEVRTALVQVVNASDARRRVSLRLETGSPWQHRELAPGEVWRARLRR